MTAGQTTPHVGRSVARIGGADHVTGRVRYTADLAGTAALRIVFVRSTCAHGEIASIDAAPALAVAGVRAVFDGADALRLTEPIPHFIDPAARGGNRADVHCLAHGRTRWAGEPLAAVVATSAAAAGEGAARIAVEYRPLPALADADAALATDATRLYDGWNDNVMLEARYGEPDVAGALAAAEHRIATEISLHRYGTAPMEPRACVARWDAATATLTVDAATQNPHQLRAMIATALTLAPAQVRVRAGALGGAFGLKMAGHREEVLVALAARELETSVAWVEDRRETFLAAAREQRHRVEVGFDGDGRLRALAADIVTDVGAASAQPGWAMSNLAALTLPTGYRLQALSARVRVVVTNKPPWVAARGFGKEAANFVMERVIDLVAAHLGVDPVEVRRRNLLRPDELPYRTATGLRIDSGDYLRALDDLLDELRYDEWRRRREEARAAGRLLGIGVAFELTPEASDSPGMMGAGRDTSTVRLGAGGRATVLTGVTSPGGGNDTGIAQIVADELGLSIDAIEVVQGDTGRCPEGFGNYSGRSTLLGGSAAALAARELRDRLLDAVAHRYARDAATLTLAGGAVRSGDDGTAVTTIAEAIALAAGAGAEIEASVEYRPGNTSLVPDERGRIQPYPTYSNAVMGAVVEVDPATGAVTLRDFAACHDCGVMINPKLVEGQLRGAIAMGIGGALTEALIHDRDGRLVSDRLKTYLLPRASDLPPVRIAHRVTPSPFTLLGTKGAGEAGVGGTQAALANAVADALAPLGVAIGGLPLSAPAILAAIRRAPTPRSAS